MLAKLNQRALAYSGASLGASIVHSVFMFYYVKVFLNRYHVTEWWFQVSQTLFLIWNSVNDPLFGYCQDNVKMKCFQSRRLIILSGSFLFSLSFLVPWFPWTTDPKNEWIVGLHLIVALFFYDAMFTYVLIAHACLFAELSTSIEDRIRLVRYTRFASLIGGLSVFICESISRNLKNYLAFQITCVALALISWQCFRYTGNNCHTEWDLKAKEEHGNEDAVADRSSQYTWWQLVKQLFTNRNFICAVLLTLFSDFHRNYLSNFMAIIGDSLLPNLNSGTRSVLYGASTFLPQILIIVSTPLLSKFGYYRVMGLMILLKIMLGPCMYLIGRSSIILYAIYLLLEGCVSTLVAGPFALMFSDVIDEDCLKYKRRHPISAMVFAGNALIVKPAQSFAPMITVAIFNAYGYEKLPKNNVLSVAADSSFTPLFETMFGYSCWLPCVIGLIQIILWKCFTIRDTHKTIPVYNDNVC
ncbi:transmembrane protein 180-like [Tubulanus polymorphus]|uniref:transmembrane protein 180-like n=1 Tax=Tubulanus polymorphus TaxID=672921 RepID=UPI003DA253D4